MAKVLKETGRSIAVTATAKSGNFEYAVSYSFEGKELLTFRCNVSKVEQSEEYGEQRTYSGYMSFENGSKSLNFPAECETAIHVALFEQMLAEVREEIGA